MRTIAAAAFAVLVAGQAGAVAAQTGDRYGGVNPYPPPAYAQQQRPERVLSWPGKSMPAPAPAPAPAPTAAYYPGQPQYGAALQPPPYAQARGAPPAPYAAQRSASLYPPPAGAYPPPVAYYPYPAQGRAPQAGAPQPYAPAPTGYQPYPQPGPPQATAPSGVYPALPGYPQPGYPVQGMPQSAYPPAPFAQGLVPQTPFPSAANGQSQPMQPSNGAVPPPPPPPPASIYAPAPQADAEPAQPRMLAMNTASPENPGPRTYSIHRDFGLQPDHPQATAPDSIVDLVEPDAADPDPGLRNLGEGDDQ